MSTLLRDIRDWFRPVDDGEDVTLAPYADHPGSASPHAFIVEDEEGICKLIAMTLATIGVEAESFHSAQAAAAALDKRLPAIILRDVALEAVHRMDCNLRQAYFFARPTPKPNFSTFIRQRVLQEHVS